jgi:hypothetical protein
LASSPALTVVKPELSLQFLKILFNRLLTIDHLQIKNGFAHLRLDLVSKACITVHPVLESLFGMAALAEVPQYPLSALGILEALKGFDGDYPNGK